MTGFDETVPPTDDPTEDAQATPEYEKETDQAPEPLTGSAPQPNDDEPSDG